MIKNNLVSVIIPVYNRIEPLRRAIASVAGQYRDGFKLEIIVVDDGSTVDVKSVVDSFVHTDGVDILYIRNTENRGVSFSRNRGIEASHGEYIAFLDSDDEYVQKKIHYQLEFMMENPDLLISHTDEIWIRAGVRVNPPLKFKKSNERLFERSLEQCVVATSTIMVRRELFDKYGMLNESLVVCEDYEFFLRVMMHDFFGFVDKLLTIRYGGSEDQLSFQYKMMDKYMVEALICVLNTCKTSIKSTQIRMIKDTLLKKAIRLRDSAVRLNLANEVLYYKDIIGLYL